MNQITNPVKAIRAKCIDCMGGQTAEVPLCPSADCALYPFRMGRNPFRTKREYTEEQLEAKRENIRRINEARKARQIVV